MGVTTKEYFIPGSMKDTAVVAESTNKGVYIFESPGLLRHYGDAVLDAGIRGSRAKNLEKLLKENGIKTMGIHVSKKFNTSVVVLDPNDKANLRKLEAFSKPSDRSVPVRGRDDR